MDRQRQEARVRRRRVFYIPGFDPFPPRRYRELYRSESARQAQLSGYAIAQKPLPGAAATGWRIRATVDGAEVQTDYSVLPWADIVQGSMTDGVGATYLKLARTLWIYLASGTLLRLTRLRGGPVIAALYPAAVLLAQALVAGLVAAGLWWAGGALLPAPWGGWAGLAAGLAAGWGVLELCRRQDGRLLAWYLMHDYAFTARLGGANPPELEARLVDFAATIRAALAEDWDEVLIVGHSSGAHLAVSVVADALRAGGLRPDGPPLALLTLGQAVPMQSFLPGATRLRADLHHLAAAEEITWVDVSAPGDGCSFALCDPVAVSGVAPERRRWPLVLSAAFSKSLAPETWARLKRKYFSLHFQYLRAFDGQTDYDYFRITAGPLRLADRYRGRAPSPGRIETPVNPHTARAPA